MPQLPKIWAPQRKIYQLTTNLLILTSIQIPNQSSKLYRTKNSSTPLIPRLLDKMNILSKNNSIILTWIPSHISLQGNESADKAAKNALLADISNTKIPYTDLKPITNSYLRNSKNLGIIKHRTSSTLYKIP